ARRDRRHARSEDGKRQAAALSRPHAAARATGSGTRVRQQRRRQESRDRRRDAWRTRMRTNIPSCRHEPDVTAAIVDGRWGDETLASLREHARACSVCRDVVAVADALGPDPGEAIAIPAAGQVLWRARVRARAEAAQRATRPLLAAQALAAACL